MLQILGDDEEDSEYQRFLSSLLPHEQENLSFLDEEDEEYRPEEDDDEEEDEEDAAAVANRRDRVTVKISKKELTDLLWDSTRLGLPLPGTRASVDTLPLFSGAALDAGSLVGKSSEPAGGDSLQLPAANPLASVLFQPHVRMPAPAWLPRRPSDGSVPIPPPVQELHGAISQEQCIHLASQMHKHFQLLLQSFHLFAASGDASDSDGVVATDEDAERRRRRKLEAAQECKKMMEELQARGDKAQQFKGELLAKLSSVPGAHEDAGASRRVTRSVTAAHAAVSHPSMFELVGSQALDELTSKLAESCTLQERNRVIQEQMLELDQHLLGTKRKHSKKPFTHAEDNLLAHGAKRFALHPDSWSQIQKHFLPGKSTAMIQRRYKYLTSNKTGMSAVKEYHAQFPRRRDAASWILEEDLRIARGMIEFHGDKRRFARVGFDYLPHRGRLQIRKRWERIRLTFYETIAAQNPSIDFASIDFAVLVKDLLEDKLRAQVKQQSLELIENDGDSDSAMKQEGLEPASDDGMSSARRRPNRLLPKNASACTSKQLHPALFFTSWALINPGSLLSKTCAHNLPSFVEEMHQEQANEAPPNSAASITTTVENQDAAVQSSAGGDGVDPSALHVGDFTAAGVSPAIGFPDDSAVARLANSVAGADGSWAERLIGKEPPLSATVASNESEPSTANTSAVLEDDEEDDDSDYEHDELVSSDGDHESDSDEFEQLELSDDDDDDEEDDDEEEDEFGYVELGIDDDDEDDDDGGEEEGSDAADDSVSTAASTPSTPLRSQAQQRVAVSSATAADRTLATQSHHKQQQRSPSSRPIRHTLRLQNLLNPDSARTKRALEALERRIVGTSVKDVLVKPPAARPAGKRRIVSSVLTEAARDKTRLGFEQVDDSAPSEVAPPTIRGADAALPSGGDAYNDNDFECEELLDDSSDGEENVAGELDVSTFSSVVPPQAAPVSSPVQEQREPWQPNKKLKLRCSACNRSESCSCSRRREERPLRRMRPGR